jgi:hypothetical protein
MVNAPRDAAKKADRPTHEARVAQSAGELIAEYGSNEVYAAIARLNDAIDRGDRISFICLAEARVPGTSSSSLTRLTRRIQQSARDSDAVVRSRVGPLPTQDKKTGPERPV